MVKPRTSEPKAKPRSSEPSDFDPSSPATKTRPAAQKDLDAARARERARQRSGADD